MGIYNIYSRKLVSIESKFILLFSNDSLRENFFNFFQKREIILIGNKYKKNSYYVQSNS